MNPIEGFHIVLRAIGYVLREMFWPAPAREPVRWAVVVCLSVLFVAGLVVFQTRL